MPRLGATLATGAAFPAPISQPAWRKRRLQAGRFLRGKNRHTKCHLNMTDQSVILQAMKQAVRKRSKRAAVARRVAGSFAAGSPAGPGQSSVAAGRGDARSTRAAARREAILDAALDEFSAQGFAAARLDDIATRARVAKGTIYLYFADKEMLFQELIRARMGPVVGDLEAVFATELPLRVIVEQAVDVFVREVFGTHRKQIIRLVISEGPR